MGSGVVPAQDMQFAGRPDDPMVKDVDADAMVKDVDADAHGDAETTSYGERH
jgi:hypothetical protein